MSAMGITSRKIRRWAWSGRRRSLPICRARGLIRGGWM
ncbi:hypothetical protein BMETH_1193_0 [methanotrophic bacterial endosymbiont of Bathymodiolus sp.]|nr:hypothetical protein BMETH_1193_0 [methanotrophic bacterial endosymbiont of Bathymodiolus sp.]